MGAEQVSFDAEGERSFLAGELDRCRAAYEAGVKIALIDALWLCSELPPLTPKWVLEATLATFSKGSLSPPSAGRTGNELAAYRSDMIHFDRWATVSYIRDVQSRDRGAGNIPVRYNLTGAGSSHREKLEPGASWEVAYRRASVLLRGSDARGAPGTMKKSYELVQREMKLGNSARFHVPASPTLMTLLKEKVG